MRKPFSLLLMVAALGSVTSVQAGVSQAEADKLKGELMPLGGVRAANADGTIPAWDGGITKAPDCYKGPGTRYCDPFPNDKPLFTITGQNVAQYRDKLTVGQIEICLLYTSPSPRDA